MARSLTASADVFVRRDLHRVWELICDVERFETWVEGVRNTRWTSATTFENDRTRGGRTNHVTYEIVAHEPPRRLTMRATSGPYPYEGTIELEAADGGTRVRHTMTTGPDGAFTAFMFTVFGPLLRLKMRRRLRDELERFRKSAEAPSSARSDAPRAR
jgi:uncharacterized protein YndB with AHSA1/START domain